ncbi:MAG: asparagine synthase (glutamine-hydrolyzing) [Planctomycetes bacterium]|nr:asparagine synthase (glutamine-hydrolyzing) [Planctomycetota bacterium]
MCGILALASLNHRTLGVAERTVCTMREVMAHRGPDGAGVLMHDGFALAHRRLAIVDPSERGRQPMTTPDGRYAIVYNGELYNDAEVRRDLSTRGITFGTQSDTETLLHALVTWGTDALLRLRGMYAFAFADLVEKTLLLARDPLGIKPLYFTVVDGYQVVAASEVRAVLAHPRVSAAPDLVTVSSYLTTIRTTLGHRTLFENVHVLEPGQALRFDLAGERIGVEGFDVLGVLESAATRNMHAVLLDDDAGELARVRAGIEDSVQRHLRSDVPLCSLLSGGVDSTIIAALTARQVNGLRTFAAGAVNSDDLPFASVVASGLGTRHAEALVDQNLFEERWVEMVQRLGLPLSTPNEVAINTVAKAIRATGCKVALSGEGADELFAGYDSLMDACISVPTQGKGADPGGFHMRAAAWVGPEAKQALLHEDVYRDLNHDEQLHLAYAQHFDALAQHGIVGMDAHLAFQRRVNLVGLLQRLDTAMMLEGVEGRTPFADVNVAAIANSVPMRLKYQAPDSRDRVDSGAEARGGTAVATAAAPRTKLILRRACADLVPHSVLQRPKASFPVPFHGWMQRHAGVLRTSGLSQALFNPAAIETMATQPQSCWQFAWPAINIAMWGQRWWGG